jgi:hypothetical protein
MQEVILDDDLEMEEATGEAAGAEDDLKMGEATGEAAGTASNYRSRHGEVCP